MREVSQCPLIKSLTAYSLPSPSPPPIFPPPWPSSPTGAAAGCMTSTTPARAAAEFTTPAPPTNSPRPPPPADSRAFCSSGWMRNQSGRGRRAKRSEDTRVDEGTGRWHDADLGQGRSQRKRHGDSHARQRGGFPAQGQRAFARAPCRVQRGRTATFPTLARTASVVVTQGDESPLPFRIPPDNRVEVGAGPGLSHSMMIGGPGCSRSVIGCLLV